MKWKLFVFVFFGCLVSVFGQELKCKVVVDYRQVQTVNQTIFQNMERTFNDFMNQTIWTRDEFQTFEKINCNIIIKISQQQSLTSYTATAQVQSTRPIFGTDYESTVLTFIDQNFEFSYNDGQDLIFNESGFNTNLVAQMAFYAYMIIGMDYDSFSKLGGTTYYEKARLIVNNAQSIGGTGWKQEDGSNSRYWLLDNMVNNQFEKFREGLYIYHFEAMDKFVKDPVAAQTKILGVLMEMKKIRDINPSSILLKTYLLAKTDELVKTFQGAQDARLKMQAMNLLMEMDPARAERYRLIMN